MKSHTEDEEPTRFVRCQEVICQRGLQYVSETTSMPCIGFQSCPRSFYLLWNAYGDRKIFSQRSQKSFAEPHPDFSARPSPHLLYRPGQCPCKQPHTESGSESEGCGDGRSALTSSEKTSDASSKLGFVSSCFGLKPFRFILTNT